MGQVTTGGHEGHVTVGVVGQLQTGGGLHVGHVGHASVGMVVTEEGEEMKIDIIYSNASFSSKSSHQFLPTYKWRECALHNETCIP